jgi:hypothetical protein
VLGWLLLQARAAHRHDQVVRHWAEGLHLPRVLLLPLLLLCLCQERQRET